MDIVLVLLAFFCLLLGLAGAIIPVLPGPPLSYLGLWFIQWSGYGNFTPKFMWIWAGVTLVVTLADYYLPVAMTKRFGGSRSATVGTLLGLVAGIFFFPPVGLIVGPFLGAFVGELLNDRSDNTKALRVAMGSFVAFICGTGAKLIASGVMIFYAVRAFFV